MRRLSGFSLMEMMIVLAIVAIVAAASAPMLNKKIVSSTEGKSWWEQVDNSNSIAYNFSGAGIDNNTVNIGGILKNETNPPRLFIESKNTNPHIYFRNGDKNLKLTIGDNSINLKDTDEVMHAQSTIIGFGADTIDNASNSTAFGSSAKAANAATAFGESATASGEYSIAIGTITTASGANSIAIGSSNASATSANATKNYAIAIGSGASASGEQSIAVGNNAITDAQDTIAIGYSTKALKTNSTALGYMARAYITNSTAIGASAEAGKITETNYEKALNSTAVGYNAKATAKRSTAIGANAIAQGDDSIAIGTSAKAIWENSIAIGNSTKDNPVETTKRNQIVLGSSNTTVYIPGNLVVDNYAVLGRTNETAWTYLRYRTVGKKGNSHLRRIQVGEHSDDKLYWSDQYNGEVSGYALSDRHLKNIGKAFKGGLAEIKKLEVFNYTFKDDSAKTPRVGVIAQDLKKIFPDAVIKGEDGFLRIRMEDMFYALVNAVKELDSRISLLEQKQKQINELETQVGDLKSQVNNLEKRLADLEKSK